MDNKLDKDLKDWVQLCKLNCFPKKQFISQRACILKQWRIVFGDKVPPLQLFSINQSTKINNSFTS